MVTPMGPVSGLCDLPLGFVGLCLDCLLDIKIFIFYVTSIVNEFLVQWY